jgi:hypothetical protein
MRTSSGGAVTSLLVRAIPWLVLIAVAYAAGCHYNQDRTLKSAINVLADRVDSLKGVAAQVDTVYTTDTLNLTKVRLVTDSLLVTETVIKTEVVTVLLEKERQACDAVIATCEQRVAQRDTIIAGLDSIVKLQKKRTGSDWKTKLGYLLGGVAAGALIPR